MVIVTGATGHIGNVLVRELLEKGNKVKAIILPGENTKSIDELVGIEKVDGNILDLEFLRTAFKGEDVVYHLAGIVDITPDKTDMLYKVNVEGTKNVVQACLDEKIKKLAYVSSSEARYAPAGKVMDESCGFDPARVEYPYQKSKALATQAVLDGIKRGLDAVIISPTGVIGPYDYKPSLLGNMIIKVTKLKFLPIIKGSYDFVDVRDVAHGIILACESKKSNGKNYIISGGRISVKNLLNLVKGEAEKKPFYITIPYKLAKFVSAKPFFRKKIPELTPQSIDILQTTYSISHEKARKELGYSPRNILETIKDTYFWFKKKGMAY